LHSNFWDPSSSGLGTWGEAKDDFEIQDGGFKDVVRVYPSPHHIRRNYSLFPLSNPDLIPPFGPDPAAPPRNVSFRVNDTMSRANVDFIVNGFEGNYFAFQSYFESTNVSPTLFVISRPF